MAIHYLVQIEYISYSSEDGLHQRGVVHNKSGHQRIHYFDNTNTLLLQMDSFTLFYILSQCWG